MIRIALAVQFTEEHQAALLAAQTQAVQAGFVTKTSDLPFYVNVASWLLPNAAAADPVLKAVEATQQLDLDVFPAIQLESKKPQLILQPIMTHILNVWHFQMHKALELPYLADDERDVPKRWRPGIQIGEATTLPSSDIAWPKRLRCDKFIVFNKDTDELIAEQSLAEMTAIPW